MGRKHNKSSTSEKNLKIAFFLNLGFTILEIIGGIYVNSVAILSDAVHDLGDSLSLGTAWYLDKKSKQTADNNFSFGYARFSLLGALINSLVLILGSIFIIKEAIERIYNPETPNADGMILFALLGIVVNGYAAKKISGGKTLNEKVISWHLIEDVLGWVAVLIVAIVLKFKNIPLLDPALSILITLYIFWGVIKRLKETLYLFLQGVPDEIDLLEIKKNILSMDHIASLHHTHLWSLEGEKHIFSTHIKLNKSLTLDELKCVRLEVKKSLAKYQFDHCTVQFDLFDEECSLE